MYTELIQSNDNYVNIKIIFKHASESNVYREYSASKTGSLAVLVVFNYYY